MPKSYNEVRDEFQKFKGQFPDDPTDLPSFAKQLDEAQGTHGERAEAYTDGWYKQANATIDRGFQATGIPAVTGGVVGGLGGLVDSVAGTHIEPTVTRLGEDLPRMLVEGLATIPEAASGVGAPVAAATWMNRANQIRKVLGYGGSALGGYAQTDSPIGAAISAGSMGLSNKLLLPAERGGMDIAGKTAGAIRDRLGIGGEKIVAEEGKNLAAQLPEIAYSTSQPRNIAATLGGVGAEAAAQTGVNELTRQAQLSVGPNAVGLTDPARNPFTEENIAGNVAGLLPFAPQLIHGARSASGFDARQAKPLAEWIRNRKEATIAEAHAATSDVQFDLESALKENTFSEKDSATLRQSIMTELAAARSAEAEGRTADAERYHARAAEILDRTGMDKLDLTTANQTSQEIGTEARMMAPSTPEGLHEFVGKVNNLIDFWNENRAKVAEGEIEAVDTTREIGGHTNLKQSGHENARDPSVVARLQEKGLLPKIDYEWLQKQYAATFDDSGNPKFAQDVLAQKVANHLLDNVPEALKAESALGTQAEVPTSKKVEKVNDTEREFFRALASFPPELLDGPNGLVNRTIKFRTSKDYYSEGRQLNRYGSWQRAVITAANTYNPADQTVVIHKGGKPQKVSVTELLKSDFNPVFTPVKAGEGGKGKVVIKGRTIPETNLESLRGSNEKTSFEPGDEATLSAELAESGGEGLEGMQQLKYKPASSAEALTDAERLKGGTGVGAELEIPEQAQTGLATQLSKHAEVLGKTIPKLTPEQAWNLMRPVIVGGGRATDVSFYEKHAKTLLEALPDLAKRRGDEISPAGQQLVAAWTATGRKLPGTPLGQVQNLLTTLLKSHVELPGVSQMTTTPRGDRMVANRAETAMARARLIVERLTQKKAVDVSGGYKGPMRMDVYHGTPHGVDRFDTSKIGTGEGAQTYGWGLYFAENPQVAESYQQKLSRGLSKSKEQLEKFFTPGNIVPAYGGFDRVESFDWNNGNWNVTVKAVQPKYGKNWKIESYLDTNERSRTHSTEPTDKALHEAGVPLQNGNLYKVNLADDLVGKMLEWDKPLNEQSPEVQRILRTFGYDKTYATVGSLTPNPREMLGSEIYTDLAQKFGNDQVFGQRGGKPWGAKVPSDEAASRKLNELGIPGIRYLDQGSRPDGKGTSNFVIFDGANAKILEENGRAREMRLTENGPEMTDNLSGTPRTLSEDAAAAVGAAIDRHFGEKGYSGDMRTMAQAAAMAIVRTLEKVPVDLYKIKGENVAGLANADMVPGRGQVGLHTDPIGMEDSSHFVHRVLTALTHELAHIDDFVHFGALKAPDAYSEERKRQLENLRSMYGALDPEQRKSILTTLDEGLTPKGYRRDVGENPVQLQRAMTDVEEFSATVMSLVTKSLLFGKGEKLNEALKTLDFSPIEVQEYAQFQFRGIRDVLQAMEGAVSDKALKDTNPYVLAKAFHAVTSAAIEASRVRDGVKEVALARDMVKAMTKGASTVPLVESDAVWHRRQKEVQENFGKMSQTGPYAMANAKDAMEMASEAMGLKSYGKNAKPGWWARWAYPYANLMRSMERAGVDLARPLSDLILNTESAVHRRYTDIMSPFIKQRADGTRAWNDDHPLIKQQNPAVRKGINEVSEWQAANGHIPMFVTVEGELVPGEKSRPVWDKIRNRYSLADQQTIVSASVAMDQVGQNMARYTLSVLDESMTIRTARLLQTLDKRLTYDQAFAQADSITQAYQSGQPQGLTGLDPKVMQAVEGMLGGPSGLVAQFGQVKGLLDARTGFRTEQLPHDWIVMYKNTEGETKFLSAPTEKQAYYAKDRLAQQGGTPIGEIVNKNDLRSKYQAFDDPDVLLSKFAQVEGRQWDKAIEAVQAGFGPEVAEELRGAYTPGAASLKDIGTQGFNKFLKGSESQVDRGSFDYLDAMLARAARLAASASYKTHGGMKDLILNDRRTRMFPTLQNIVNEHWDNMLAPTSDLTKKVKALSTSYFLGANLASAAVEGTQSIMTVIPNLIATNEKGGPVKAYAQLGKAIADAGEVSLGGDWQKVAAAAEGKVKLDPNVDLTVKETQALMYRRAVADGVIGHGAIEELVFGADQKTAQLAKFGQGEYGPVPLSEMVTKPIYMGSKLMMSLYSPVSKFNDKISFFAGLNQGIEKGLTGDELYNHARQFKTLTTFGGGKANAPGWVTQAKTPFTRSAVGMVNTLQQYGYGMVATYAQFAKDSIDSSKSLTPQQRVQARKAFGTMLATQVAVGGVLGVPFAGAALTLVEKLFGVPANQLVREGLASLGSDEEDGGVIAETALNGLGNQMFGLDVSSRVGVSNLMGTSAYRGFNVQDMMGPVPGLLSNFAQGLNWFGQNEPVRAAQSLVPAAFKNSLAMADSHRKYGDLAIRDGSENLIYTPSQGQNIARAFGFRSREESQKRLAGNMTGEATKRLNAETDREGDKVAQRLLQGDSETAKQYARELHFADPATSTNDVLRGVMEKAVKMTQERDLLAGVSRRNSEEVKGIVNTFGPDVNTRQSEMDAVRLRMQLAAKLGAPDLIPSGKAMQKATMVDAMVRNRNMSRSQAQGLVEMMGL